MHFDPVREDPAVKYLVSCPCSHTLDDHDAAGCSKCGCTHDQWRALDAAVDAVATAPWLILKPKDEAS